MIYKELRETAGLAALALAVLFALITAEMGMRILPLLESGRGKVPFLGSTSFFVFVMAIFTIALGFRQTAWELWQGTFMFLLHRPVARERLILAKLLIGGAVYLVCSAVPVLCFAFWAATPGTHASPFFWSMTFPIWKIWIAMTVLYVGAFASGLLDGRWLGRRLLPLACAAVATGAIAVLPWWWLTGFPLLLISLTVGVVIVFHIARRREYS
jgi:hypothetical protein